MTKKQRLFILLLFLALPFHSAMAVIELGGSFSYRKNVFGSNLEDSSVTRAYTGNIAFYFYEYTALEFNYSAIKEITTTKDDILIPDTGYSVTGTQSIVDSKVYGIGLKQSFAPRKSLIVPSLSLGYAKQFVNDSRDITYRQDSSKTTFISSGSITKRRIDSMFGTFALKFRLTKLLSLTGSVYTLFPSGDWNKAKDSLKYMAGFTWYF